MKVPPPNVSDFPVGALVHGQVKWLAEFGLFIEFRYHAAGCRWGIDGLLHFERTANAEGARALGYDDWVEVVVTAYDATKMKLAVACQPTRVGGRLAWSDWPARSAQRWRSTDSRPWPTPWRQPNARTLQCWPTVEPSCWARTVG